MKLYSLLSEDQTLVDVKAKTLPDAVRLILETLAPKLRTVTVEDILKELNLEKNADLCMVKEGIAIPHARVPNLNDFFICLATSKQGVESLSKGKAHWIFLILTSQTKNTLMLQALAAVAKLLSNKEIRDALLSVKTPARIIKLIEESGIDVKKTITAVDIMSTEFPRLNADEILIDAVEDIIPAGTDILPVISSDNILLGDLSSREIIKVGLPSYMGMLQNVDFLTTFEPFENYFKEERRLKVGDIMNTDILRTTPDTSIIEVAHDLISNNHLQVYVVKDNQLVGVINRKDILAKVLQF